MALPPDHRVEESNAGVETDWIGFGGQLVDAGRGLVAPAYADTIVTLTAETPPVTGRFTLSFTDSGNDGIYTPPSDQFVPGSLVWSGGWQGFNGVLTELVSAPSNAYCAYTNDAGGQYWVFQGPGSYQKFDTTILSLTYTETVQAVPCPPAALLLVSGLIPLAWLRR